MQFGIPIVSRQQWCPWDKIEDHVFHIHIVENNGATRYKIEKNGATTGDNSRSRLWDTSEDKFNNDVTGALVRKMSCLRHGLRKKLQVCNVDPCAGGDFCESDGALTMIPVYENELNVALEKGEHGVVMSEYGFE
ncbi:hypothetical protein ACFE04_006867 [Oxalis oulophora]